MLRSISKKMCCLGFYAKACLIPESKLEDNSTLAEVNYELSKSNEYSVWDTILLDNKRKFNDDSYLAEDLMSVNDNRETTDDQKEKKIKKMFAENGITVKFVP